MKVLVLATAYPSENGSIAHRFVHVRNKGYHSEGIEVRVLNFSAKQDYVYEDIPVITLDTFKRENKDYDFLISHQPNLRRHLPFVLKYGSLFSKLIFFFHGHEVLKINKVYSAPYPYVQKNPIKTIIQNIYDSLKLYIWRKYYTRYIDRCHLVFVSKWMLTEFLKWTKINPQIIENKYSVIYNCVGKSFELSKYDASAPKEYDFVTVRGNIDGSKYSVDIINRLAFNSPDQKFLLVGKGTFFDHYTKAPNLEWHNQTMSHGEIIEILQKSKYALMPTRTDAQGLMMCEMAAMGIPVITSDIPICHEVFDGFENVHFISNDDETLSLAGIAEKKPQCVKDTRFNEAATVMQEVHLLNRLFAKD